MSYTDNVINKNVRIKIKQTTGPYEHLLTTFKKCTLKQCSHVSRSSGLVDHHATYNEGWENKKKGEEEIGRQHRRMDKGIRRLPKGHDEQSAR